MSNSNSNLEISEQLLSLNTTINSIELVTIAYHRATFEYYAERDNLMVNIDNLLAERGIAKATVDYKAALVEDLLKEKRQAYYSAKAQYEALQMRLQYQTKFVEILSNNIEVFHD